MKEKMIGSIIKSNRSFGTNDPLTGKVLLPDMNKIRKMTFE